MEVKHLQSLIKRNSNRITELEYNITALKGIEIESYPYFKRKWKKEIKQLAILQRELKKEIETVIFVSYYDF